ncbi:MAG: FixH family protein [Acidobacteriota bacterium]
MLFFLAFALTACGTKEKAKTEVEAEAFARTEFTERLENYFEYEPLKAGRASQFLIHLTDLTDGSPVEKADVTLTVRSRSGAEVGQTNARIGKVTGIYVADLTVNSRGDYDIEFHIKNDKLDERLPLKDFQVE